jgi:esterase/lipase superfamily enzyme
MFGNALVYATFLKERYSDVPFNIGLFSWPSDGQLIPYMSDYRDRDDARGSGRRWEKFSKAIEYLECMRPKEYCDQRLHLILYRVGNYTFRHGV